VRAAICLLGAGAINLRHARLLRRLRPRARIAVASRDPERARRFASKVRAEVVPSYRHAIESDDYNVIAIGVPPVHHAGLVESALATGKHVLVEKPAFASLAELQALLPALRAHGQVFMTAENTHFDPFHREVKAIVESGELGAPLVLDLARLGCQPVTAWRSDAAEMPLGALHEGGVHWIRRVLDLASAFDPDRRAHVESVHARTTRLGDTPHEDTAVVVAQHRSGLVTRLFHSWALPRLGVFARMAYLQCERGWIRFDPHGVFGIVRGPRKRRWLLPRFRSAYRAMWEHFLECVEEGGVPELGLDELIDDFTYLDAAYRSARSATTAIPTAVAA